MQLYFVVLINETPLIYVTIVELAVYWYFLCSAKQLTWVRHFSTARLLFLRIIAQQLCQLSNDTFRIFTDKMNFLNELRTFPATPQSLWLFWHCEYITSKPVDILNEKSNFMNNIKTTTNFWYPGLSVLTYLIIGNLYFYCL